MASVPAVRSYPDLTASGGLAIRIGWKSTLGRVTGPLWWPIRLTPYIRAAIRIRSVRRSVVFLSWKRVAARAIHKEECHHTDEGQKSNLHSHAHLLSS